MTTALTLYYCRAASTTLSTAGALASTTGGTLGNNAITLGTNTGYGELYALTAETFPNGGTGIGNPSGNGFLWDVTTLEGQQIIAGTWTVTIRLQLSGAGVTGSLTVDLYARVFRRSSTGIYTQIGSTMSKTGNTVNTTVASFTFAGASLPLATFSGGDKAYTDAWANVTANNATGGTATIKFFSTTTAGQGINTAQIVTPGYQQAIVGNVSQHRSIGRVQ